MGSNNKYGSITETFLGDPLINIQLNAKATPPADLALILADFSVVNLYANIVGGVAKTNFMLGDVPRLVGVGIWCNIGDGLVQNDNPDDPTTGLVMQISGQSYNQGNVLQQANIQVPSFCYKIPEFNAITDVDKLLDMSPLDYTLTGVPKGANVTSGYYILTAAVVSATMNFATITVDPAFATKRLIMRPMVVIEHTYPVFQ